MPLQYQRQFASGRRPFDYEAKSSYTVTVRVTHSSGLSYDKVFTIAIQNVVETALVYVDDDWAGLANGTAVADADPSVSGNQPATVGITAFASLPPAVAAVDAGGTGSIVSRPGTYAANVVLDRPVALNVIGNAVVRGIVSGPQPLVKQGAGVLTLDRSQHLLWGHDHLRRHAATRRRGRYGLDPWQRRRQRQSRTFNRSDVVEFRRRH